MPSIILDGIDLNAVAVVGTRIAALDVGTKTIGVALSDTGHTLGSPSSTIKRAKLAADIAALTEVIAKNKVSLFVVGLPMNMDGSEGSMCQSVRQFVKNLGAEIAIPLVFWDERMTTLSAYRSLMEFDISHTKRKEVVDQVAASYILQGFLDWFSMQKNKV